MAKKCTSLPSVACQIRKDSSLSIRSRPAGRRLSQHTIDSIMPLGADRLLIVSIGTGTFRPRLDAAKARRMAAAGLAIKALAGMIADAGTNVLTQMQMLGRSDTPWVINSEIGDLSPICLPQEPLFTFQRYDAQLEKAWLADELGIRLSDKDLEIVRKMEDPRGIPMALEIGQAAAERFMQTDHIRNLKPRAQRVG